MEFCDLCENLLYPRADTETLTKYCKHCTFTKTEEVATGTRPKAVKITESLYADDDLLYLQFNNPYLRYDPSLPRISDPSLPCPNSECTGPQMAAAKKEEFKNQVLYVKYHPVQMKYLYCCDYCGHTWR